MIHIEAYVVHVDMVLRQEVTFKLTEETIKALESLHITFLCVEAAITWEWVGKNAYLKSLRSNFVQAINIFVYRTDIEALEGLEKGGSGELSCGSSADVKEKICHLFVPMAPPPCMIRVPQLDWSRPWTPGAAFPWWASDLWNPQTTNPLPRHHEPMQSKPVVYSR